MNIQLPPTTATRLKKALYRLLDALGYINSIIILTGIFFLLLTPIGIVHRLFGKSILAASEKKSLWSKRGDPGQFERPF